MKLNYCLLLGVLVAVNATAQNTNSLPPIPAPANAPATTAPLTVDQAVIVPNTNVPAKKPAHKHKKVAAKTEPKKVAAKAEAAPVTKKIVFSEAPITLAPGTAEVCVSNLNVRGQAGLKGEVVAHVQKGDVVTVLSQINLDKHKADEPAQWAKIALPASVDVWVRTSFIDAKDKTVKPKKLNLRGGPSEDYSVLGVVEQGTVVTEVGTKGEWTKISAPTNAFGYIAAMYLKQEASGNVPTNLPPSTEVPVTPAPPMETNTIPTTLMTVVPPQQIPNTTPETTSTNTTLLPPPIGTDTNTPAVTDTNTASTVDTNVPPPPPRIVTHEGYVRSSVSIVAPTYYELFDPTTEQAINYLYATTTNLNLANYVGRHITVTGEEALDARWTNTPMLKIQKIYVLSTNVLTTKPVKSPRASQTH